MTDNDFRRIALSMPEAVESAHMNHPDFRVDKKIFATLWPDRKSGMVKLKPEDQRQFVASNPGAFVPAKGAWGLRGATQVILERVDRAALRAAIVAAWRNIAPKRLTD